MTLRLVSTSDTFKMALFKDSALDMTREEYNEYLKSCEPSLLKLKEGEQPTLFIIRKVLPSKLAKKVASEQVTLENGEMKLNMGFIIEEVRAAICGVENSPDIAYKADSDGGCCAEIIDGIVAMEMHNDIFTARRNMCGDQGVDKKK